MQATREHINEQFTEWGQTRRRLGSDPCMLTSRRTRGCATCNSWYRSVRIKRIMLKNDFWLHIKARFKSSHCGTPLAVGIVLILLCVVIAAFAKNGGMGMIETFVLCVVLLAFACSAFILTGCRWLKTSVDTQYLSSCHYCGFSLRGHESLPILCPECGKSPRITSGKWDAGERGFDALFTLLIVLAVLSLLVMAVYLTL